MPNLAEKNYLIHDNGGRPFRVNIIDKDVRVYKNGKDDENDIVPDELLLTYKNVRRIFVGKSPLNDTTAFSGGHGGKFDGNSVLIHVKENDYVYIGRKIYSFHPLNKIVKYVSHVGNSDVPYPYAIDTKGYFYLMIEDVILTKTEDINKDDPYRDYYDNNGLVQAVHLSPPPPCDTIYHKFYINDEDYNLRYYPDVKGKYEDLINEEEFSNGHPFPNRLFITYKDDPNKRIELDKKTYEKIIRNFGKERGYLHLKHKVLQERIW